VTDTTATAAYPVVTRAEAAILRRAHDALVAIANRAGAYDPSATLEPHARGRLTAKAGVAHGALFTFLVDAEVYGKSPQATSAVQAILAR
jgi:hypothetical protein